MEAGATDTATAVEDSSAPIETLAPESPERVTSEQPGKEQAAPEIDLEGEQVIEFGGKTYTLKGKELQSVLDSHQALTEKEKALNRDYTQKMQALQAERKSFQSAFGRMPEPQELHAMSKLFQAYFADESAAKVIDAILSGQDLQSVLGQSTNPSKSAIPEVSALQQKIRSLETQLSQFVSGSEQEKQQAIEAEGRRNFDTWKNSKQSQGVNVPEEIIDAVIETAGVLLRRNTSWDVNKALDEALRRETIDQVENQTAKKLFAKADSAKKAPTIKITPKSPVKSDAASGYADIFRSAM